MGELINMVAVWMGWAIRFFYNLTFNYGVAIILFTIFIKLVLIPLNYKQQKSMKKTQELQPILKGLQEKYKNDQQKLSEEMSNLYKDKKINPFGGCLLLIIQIPIILSMYYAVQKPMTYMFPEETNEAVIRKIDEYSASNPTYKEVYYMAAERKDLINTNFLGLDLAQVPSSNVSNVLLWIIPLLSGITTVLSSKISMKQTESTGDEKTIGMQKNMMLMLPIMTTYISFIVPLGMGLYWFVNNVISVLIQVIINNKLYKPTQTNTL